MNLDMVKDFAKACREAAHDTFTDGEEIPATMGFWYGDECYLQIVSMQSGRENIMRIAHAAILSGAVDHLSLCSDSVGSKSPNKHNGEPWQQDEMQEALENKTEDYDLVFESLNVSMFSRDGFMRCVSTNYNRDRETNIIVWDKPEEMEVKDPSNESMGGVQEHIMGHFKLPTILDTMKECAELEKMFPDLESTMGVDDDISAVEALEFYNDEPVEANAGMAIASLMGIEKYIDGLLICATDEKAVAVLKEGFRDYYNPKGGIVIAPDGIVISSPPEPPKK